MKMLRNGVAGMLMAAVPVAGGAAPVRATAAVPTAGSAALAAQVRQGKDVAWGPIAVIVAALVLVLWAALDDGGDNDGEGNLSRG